MQMKPKIGYIKSNFVIINKEKQVYEIMLLKNGTVPGLYKRSEKNEGHDCSHHHLVHLKESQRVSCKEDWRNRGMKGRRYVDIWTIGYTFCHLTMIWCCGLWRYWKKNWYMNDQCKSLGIAVANVQRQNWNCKNQNFWETEI